MGLYARGEVVVERGELTLWETAGACVDNIRRSKVEEQDRSGG